MSKKPTHEGLHKYERVEAKTSGAIIYKCQLPGCPHYLPYEELAVNRLSLCWGCGGEVLLTKEIVLWKRNPRPICPKCKEARQEKRELLKLVPTIEDEMEEESYEE